MKLKLSLIAASVIMAVSASALAEVNPFTGTRVQTEKVKAETDLQSAKNILSEEQLKAQRLAFQAKNVEKVMASDLKKLLTPPGSSAFAPGNFPPVASLPGNVPTNIRTKAPAPTEMVVAAPPARAQVSRVPKLSAVMDSGSGPIAVIEAGGQSVAAAVGDDTSVGKVTAITASSVTVGGRVIHLDPEILAMKNPDAQAATHSAPSGVPPNLMPGALR